MQPVAEERFEELVGQALDDLPPDVFEGMENVAVVVEDANPDDPDLLGLYEGIPRTDRWDYAGVLPDRIALYRLPLCALVENEQELIVEIQITIVHEVAHHLGIGEDALHRLGWG